MGVAESFGDDLDWCAGGDEQTKVRVTQVVKPDAWDVGTGEVPVEELADRLWMHRTPGGVREDRIPEFDGAAVSVLQPTPASAAGERHNEASMAAIDH
jgi:hypothetical protein